MAEPDDAALPVLRAIQERLAGFERRTDASLTDVKERLLDQTEKLDAMEGLMTWHLGLTTEQKYAIEEIQKQMKDLHRRVSDPEAQP